MANESSSSPTRKPATKAEMAAYTIGELKPHNDTVLLVEYDPSWPAMFECEAQRIRAALGNGGAQLEPSAQLAVDRWSLFIDLDAAF